MAAVLAEGETVPERRLRAARQDSVDPRGARRHRRHGANILRIRGVESLGGGSHRICPEHRGGELYRPGGGHGPTSRSMAAPGDLLAVLPAFERLGVRVESEGDSVTFPPAGARDQDDLGGQIPKIEDGIWPAFPSTSPRSPLSSPHRRTARFVFEKMFAGCSSSTSSSAWARIIICDPTRSHRGRLLYGSGWRADIRAGMAMSSPTPAPGAYRQRQHRTRPRLRADRRALARARGAD